MRFTGNDRYILSGVEVEGGEVLIKRDLWRSEDLAKEACRRLLRKLTREEWSSYLGGKARSELCPNLQ